MADPGSEDRNLPASSRKLEKARDEGNLPRSQDLGHFAALAVAIAVLVSFGPDLVLWLRETLAEGLRFDAASLREPDAMFRQVAAMGQRYLWVVIPVGLAMMSVAIAASLVVGGWNFTLFKLIPNFSGLNPLSGIGRVLSKQSLITALKACLLALMLGTIAVLYLKSHLGEFNSTWGMELPAGITHVARLTLNGLLLLLLLIFLFALVDAPLQKYLHASRLKMTHQEAKQEHKDNEGSAEVKGKLKARMREMAGRRMLAAVPLADLVVMNPTH